MVFEEEGVFSPTFIREGFRGILLEGRAAFNCLRFKIEIWKWRSKSHMQNKPTIVPSGQSRYGKDRKIILWYFIQCLGFYIWLLFSPSSYFIMIHNTVLGLDAQLIPCCHHNLIKIVFGLVEPRKSFSTSFKGGMEGDDRQEGGALWITLIPRQFLLWLPSSDEEAHKQ